MKGKKKGIERELLIKPVNQFTCCKKTMEFADFKKHLLEVHQVDVAKKPEGKKSLLAHIDGDKWFSYNWQWELKTGLKFTQYTMQARSKDSLL